MKRKDKYEMSVDKKQNRQNNLLFVIGAGGVTAGLLCPRIPVLIDLTIIFSLALALSVIAVCFFAKKVDQLSGLAGLSIASVAALLTALTASAKLLVIDRAAPTLVMHLSKFDIVTALLPVAVGTLIFVGLSIVLLTVTIKKTRLLLTLCKDYIEQAILAKKNVPEFDLVLSETGRKNTPEKEKEFFSSIHAFGRFALCLAVLISAIALLSLIGAVVSAGTSTAVSATTLISFSAGSTLSGQFVFLCVVSALGRLAQKTAAESLRQNRMTEEQFQKRIKVIAREVATAQTTNPEYSLTANTDSNYVSSNKQPASSNEHRVSSIENRVSSIQHRESSIEYAFNSSQFDDQASYNALAGLIAESGLGRFTLLTARDAGDLPVTIGVNTATRLAAQYGKTLIIDMDLKRSSVAQVFEAENCQSKAVRTCIKNLSLLSGKRLAKAKPAQLQKIFTKAKSLYDYVLIYAPGSAAEAKQMADFLTTAVFFAKKNQKLETELKALAEELDAGTTCHVLKPGELLTPRQPDKESHVRCSSTY